jgi:hypothetical protein
MRTETRPIYICEGCNREYVRRKDAEDCEAQGMPTSEFKKGDIVMLKHTPYGWYDGDKDWIAQTVKAASHDGFLYSFFYVIGKVTKDDVNGRPDPHNLRYHLFTKAMTNRNGWTSPTGHWPIVRAENVPAKVAAEAKAFRGRTTDRLIG